MMAASLNDPHTVYYDKETLKKVEAPLRGQFSGIGIQIRRDLVKDGLLVVSPIKDSPAYKAGLKAGDVITEIRRDVGPQGETLTSDQPKVISTKGMKVEEAVRTILGKQFTPIRITVEREGVDEPITFDLKRDRVEVESVLGWQRDTADDSWDFLMDQENKIGYIRLTQFARASAADMRKAVDELKEQGMQGLVLDLRFNPGGYLDTAVDICDMFIDDGLIRLERDAIVVVNHDGLIRASRR